MFNLYDTRTAVWTRCFITSLNENETASGDRGYFITVGRVLDFNGNNPKPPRGVENSHGLRVAVVNDRPFSSLRPVIRLSGVSSEFGTERGSNVVFVFTRVNREFFFFFFVSRDVMNK